MILDLFAGPWRVCTYCKSLLPDTPDLLKRALAYLLRHKGGDANDPAEDDS